MVIAKTVKRESVYILFWVAALSALAQIICALLKIWSKEILFGNLLGAAAAAGNFFLMGLTVQKAVTEDEEKAKKRIRLSMAARNIMIIAFAAAAALRPVFDLIAVLIPLFFPRLAVALRPLIDRGGKNDGKE